MSTFTASRADELTIGKLSALTGVNIETIRYYERTKVVPAPPRAANGRRVYRAADVRTLAFLRRARELGFSLNDVRALLRLGARKRLRAARFAGSRPTIATISGRRSATFVSWSDC